MTDIEERLRATFVSYREQVQADERPLSPRSARRSWPRRLPALVAAAAVMVAVGVGVVVAVRWTDEPRVSVSAGPGSVSTATQFDRAAGELCRRIDRGVNGVDPRFATTQAYLVVARSRVEVVATARSSLLSIRPADDPRRRAASARAASALHSAAGSAETALARAGAGDVEGAASALEQTDGKVRDAAGALAGLGIHECRVAASN